MLLRKAAEPGHSDDARQAELAGGQDKKCEG